MFKWQFRNVPVITYWDLQKLTVAITQRRPVEFINNHNVTIRYDPDRNVVMFNERQVQTDIVVETFQKLKKREHEAECKTLFCIPEDDALERLIFWQGHQYKVCQVREDWAPTIIIDGIVMHTLKRDPIEDARVKTQFVRKGARVLDTCACFGYTVRTSLERGARYVLAVEIDEAVLQISTFNIYSSALGADNVDLLNESILDVTPNLRDESFDVIVHDPPRMMSDTGDLYGIELYKELYRLLKRRGILFHYTGATGSKYRGLDILRGVTKRLREVGFNVFKVIEGFGLFASKP